MLKLFRQRGRNFLDKMRIGFLLLLLSVVEVPSVVPSSRVSVEAPSHQAFLFSPRQTIFHWSFYMIGPRDLFILTFDHFYQENANQPSKLYIK